MEHSPERISVLDIFKIGIGPSSSHTMGPWRAAQAFLTELTSSGELPAMQKIEVHLYGSLAKTGKGHGTRMAVVLGLSGYDPETISAAEPQQVMDSVRSSGNIRLGGEQLFPFNVDSNILFHPEECLSYHPNAIRFVAHPPGHSQVEATFYSVGGGFIVGEGAQESPKESIEFPYPIDSAEDLMRYVRNTGKTIPEIVLENELTLRSEEELYDALHRIWEVMGACMYRGSHTEGRLPGGLDVRRRAHSLNSMLLAEDPSGEFSEWLSLIRSGKYEFHEILKWVSCFALAVNEENASFGKVVTAPTNGAAGVIPAVLMYYLCFVKHADPDDIVTFLLVAGEIGSIFKKGSTISAAMGGCQAEIGVSSAMAAAALTACLGGRPENMMMAAEIAMEHHLGLTCDPVGGLVQVPCIERNSMGAIKAITAAYLALAGDPDSAKVTLDGVIKTMWDTAQDMNSKYKETSDGGLAVLIPVNITDC